MRILRWMSLKLDNQCGLDVSRLRMLGLFQELTVIKHTQRSAGLMQLWPEIQVTSQ
jgi:hypothetical protein